MRSAIPLHPDSVSTARAAGTRGRSTPTIVPRIDPGACAAAAGCTACADACSFRAIEIAEEAARVSTEDCVDCGVCLSECPTGAIERPLASPAAVAALAAGLLGAPDQRRVVLLEPRCSRPGQEPIAGSEILELPCCGYITASLIVSLVLSGADAVVVVPLRCGNGVPRETVRRQVSFAARAVAASGVGAKVHLLKRGRTAESVFERLQWRPPGRRAAREGPARLGGLMRLLFSTAADAPAIAADGFFGSVRATAACTLCGACGPACLPGAITLAPGGSSLVFDHSLCNGCGACVEVCPERRRGAVSMRRVLEPGRLAAPEFLAGDEVARCESCGGTIAPRRMLSRVQERLAGRGREAEVAGRFCPRCRLTRESLDALARPPGPRPPGGMVAEEADGGERD
jgi:ferredoxin